MFKSHALLRSVFLGSAIGVVAMAPAIAGDASQDASKRTLALRGDRAAPNVSTVQYGATLQNGAVYSLKKKQD